MASATAASISAAQAQDAPELIKRAFQHPTDRRNALREAGLFICWRIAGHVRTAELDRRVRVMIKRANESQDAAVSVTAAAENLGLSPSRASHLFVEETGLPFRTYMLWQRLIRAVDAHAAGANLTEAAQAAGFSDSAHLSRTFRRMFGLPAAALEMS